MPQLPNPDNIQRVQMRPDASVAGYSNATAPGSALAGIGGEVSKMAQDAQNQLDDLQVQNAATQLRKQELDLTLGKNGYQNVHGGDVLSQPLVDNYGAQYQTAAQGIADTLSPTQRAKFGVVAQRGLVQFQAGVMQHAMSETNKLGDENFKAGLSTEADAAAAQAANPTAVAQSLNNVNGLLATRIQQLGLANQPTLVDQITKEARGSVHMAVANSLMNSGNLPAASAYLTANSADMTGDQVKAVQSKLAPLNSNAKGVGIAQDIFNKVTAGAMSQVDAVLAIQDQTKGDKPALDAAELQLAHLQNAQAVNDQQKVGGYTTQYLQSPSPGTAASLVTQILQDDSLQPRQRAIAVEAVRNLAQQDISRNWSIQEHGWALQRHQQDMDAVKSNSIPAIQAYSAIRNRSDFDTMTPEQLASFAPQIGVANTKLLMNAQASDKQTGMRAKVDPVLLNDTIKQSGITDPVEVAHFKSLADMSLTQWKTANPGKVPAPGDMRNIVNSGLQQWKDMDGGGSWYNPLTWGGGNNVPGYAVTPGHKAVPADFYDGASKALQAHGKPVNDDAIYKMWQAQQGLQ